MNYEITSIICNWKNKKSNLLIIFPIVMELVGLGISMTAPGNKVRGGDDFGFSFSHALLAIGNSFVEGLRTIGEYISQKPFVFIFLMVIMLFIWETLMKRKIQYQFKYPGLFILYMFGTYCAMFTPGLYAGVDTSAGVPNTIFTVFVIALFSSGIYLEGWIYRKLVKKISKFNVLQFKCCVQVPMLILCLLLIYCNKGVVVKQTTDFYCLDFMTSGRAADYHAQMEERLAILLDDSQKDVVLPEMNWDQYPLMHMALMREPDEWTNTVTAQFYGKDSVTAMPRKEYEEMKKN